MLLMPHSCHWWQCAADAADAAATETRHMCVHVQVLSNANSKTKTYLQNIQNNKAKWEKKHLLCKKGTKSKTKVLSREEERESCCKLCIVLHTQGNLLLNILCSLDTFRFKQNFQVNTNTFKIDLLCILVA